MKEQIEEHYKYIVATFDEIKSYIMCPVLYHLRHVVKWKADGKPLATSEEIYLEAMRDAIRYYFSKHTSLLEIDATDMLAYFKRRWRVAHRKYKMCGDFQEPQAKSIIERAVAAVESFVKAFRITKKGYNHYRAVTANMPYEVPIGQGVKIVGTIDAVVLRNYATDEQILQVIHICSQKVCDIGVDEMHTPFYKRVTEWMFGEELNSILHYNITTPTVTSKVTKVTEPACADAVTSMRNAVLSMYVDSIYAYSLGRKQQCLACAYQQPCSTKSLRSLLTLRRDG